MLTRRASFDTQHPGLAEGMTVYSRDGERLGKLVTLADDHIVVEKGIFFPKDFTLRYDDIQDLREGSVYLNIGDPDLADWKNEKYTGWNHTDEINLGLMDAEPKAEDRDQYRDRQQKDSIQISVAEEELEAQKVARQKGEVTVHKIVHTELRHFTVPVMREEIRVERVPVQESRNQGMSTGTAADADAFEEKTINVPLMEEEVTVTKRPVVKEEVRISKERNIEEQTVEGEVRKEEVQIDQDQNQNQDLKRRKAG